ncbi:MAG: methyltransferase domain-containing protein [Candidatus Coatesbacteria bacterium]|nr:methyltransferase domain-containing protein [Candidatus Coatesbacteria bacterium]
MTEINAETDAFAVYISRLKDDRLEWINAACSDAPDTRSERSRGAISSRFAGMADAAKELESAKAPSSRTAAEFADQADELRQRERENWAIDRSYLAATRPGVLGLPKRLGLKAIRYPVKTYTDGLFVQQEAFNQLSASFSSANSSQILSLMKRGSEFEHKGQLQMEFNRDVLACVAAMSDAISSLWDALQEQKEFNSQVTSILNDVIDGSSELAASIKEQTDTRLGACENRLDRAEATLRSQGELSAKRRDAQDASIASLQSGISELRDQLSMRLDTTEGGLGLAIERIGSVEVRADAAESHLSSIDLRLDSDSEQIISLDQRCLRSESRIDVTEEGLRTLDVRSQGNERRVDILEDSIRKHDKRFETGEAQAELLAEQLQLNANAVQDVHSFFSLQVEAVDMKIEHAQIRQHENSEWVKDLEGRIDKSEEWLSNLSQDVDSNKTWLANVSESTDSLKDWLTNLDSDSDRQKEWLSTLETELKSHSDWLANIENTAKEHAEWLSTLNENGDSQKAWSGNLQKTQEEHSARLSEFAQRQKEVDYQIAFIKRRLEDTALQQRAVIQGAAAADGGIHADAGLSEDEYVIFENRFRGESAALKERQRGYLAQFKGCREVIDLGCGRGEFLELLSEEGIECKGIDSNPEMVEVCKAKGLDAETGDIVAYLEAAEDGTLGGVFCSQVVEHLQPAMVVRLCKLIARKLAPGGVLVVETIDPRSILALTNSFLLDPSHIFPVHPKLLEFCFSLTDVDVVKIENLAPVPQEARLELSGGGAHSDAGDGMALIERNFSKIDRMLFGFQDYALIGRKS